MHNLFSTSIVASNNTDDITLCEFGDLSPSLPPSLSPSLSELEALGDEYLGELDEDAGFLDAAVAAPDPPSAVPGGKDKVQVRVVTLHRAVYCIRQCTV